MCRGDKRITYVAIRHGRVYTESMTVQFIDMETGELSDVGPKTPKKAKVSTHVRPLPRGAKPALIVCGLLVLVSFSFYATMMGLAL